MICGKCGAQLRDGVKFCTECGERIGTEDNQRPNSAPQGNYGPNMNYGQGPYYNTPPASPYGARPGMNRENYGYGAMPPQKKSSTLPIILILVAAAVAAVLIIFFVMRSRNGGNPDPNSGNPGTGNSSQNTGNGKYTLPKGAKIIKNATLDDLKGKYEGEWNFSTYEADAALWGEDSEDFDKALELFKSMSHDIELNYYYDGDWEFDVEDWMDIRADDFEEDEPGGAVRKGNNYIEELNDGSFSIVVDMTQKVKDDPEYGTGTMKAHMEHSGTLYESDGKTMVSGYFTETLDTPKGKTVFAGTFVVEKVEQKPFVEENNMKITSADTIFKVPAYCFFTSNGNEVEMPGIVFDETSAYFRFYDYRVVEQNDDGYQIVSFKCENTTPVNITLAADPGFSWNLNKISPGVQVFDYYTGEKYRKTNVNVKDGEENTNKEFRYTDITFNEKTYTIGVRVETTAIKDWDEQKNADGSISRIDNSYTVFTYFIYAPKDYDGLMVGLYKPGVSKETYNMFVEYNKKLKELKAQADAGNPSEEYKHMQEILNGVRILNQGEFDLDTIFNLQDYYILRVNDIPKAAQ